ncbi:hypothetical protein BGP75_10085 [Motiliproteus sp. MSK22-1]|nr:hypothetical protein BGP75_10085 [Motiliproteus sp. MSK22-1]
MLGIHREIRELAAPMPLQISDLSSGVSPRYPGGAVASSGDSGAGSCCVELSSLRTGWGHPLSFQVNTQLHAGPFLILVKSHRDNLVNVLSACC